MQGHVLAKGSETVLRRHQNGKGKLEQTHRDVIAGWHAVAQQFQAERDYGLADEFETLVEGRSLATGEWIYSKRPLRFAPEALFAALTALSITHWTATSMR